MFHICKLYISGVTYVIAFLLIGVGLRKLLVNCDFISNTKAEFRGIKPKEIKKIVIENIFEPNKYENYVKVKGLQNFQNLCICKKPMWIQFTTFPVEPKLEL